MLRCRGRVGSQRLRSIWLIPTVQRCRLSLAYSAQEPKRARLDATEERPVVILHGLFGSKQNNRSISKALANDLGTTVYAVDLRNHGDSPHSEVHDYTSMADDVEQFIRKLKLYPVTLIGHSMGAKVAMTVALRSPEIVERLIPVDNAPVDAQLKSDFRKYVQGMRKVSQSEVSKQSDADKILKEFENSVAIRQFLLTNLSKEDDTGKYKFRIPLKILGDTLDKMGDFPYKDPTTHRFKGPTLFIRGTKSRYVADDVLPVIGNFFPAFRLVDIDCGHWVISEQPEAFRKAVIDFVKHVQD